MTDEQVFDTADERDDRRGSVERDYATKREQIEKKYSEDLEKLSNQRVLDLQNNEMARREALVGAGLNPDGSDPQGRPQGSAV